MDFQSIEDVEALFRDESSSNEGTPFPPDNEASWVYWTSADTAEQGIADDWVLERLRLRRDSLLAACDFRMVPDAPWDRAAWETYRQELRDLPDATTDPRKAVWPRPPE